MKKLLSCLITLFLILGLFAGCAAIPQEIPQPTPSSDPLPTEPAPTLSPAEDPALDNLRANLPKMDGSTSLIPLEAGIRAALYGISMEDAEEQVLHTTTWDSFFHLVTGSADLIFSVPLSQEQYDIAADYGVELELVPVAKEGFVFVVNAENPVNSLTIQQIQDIYSGKITNWAQVGGLDEPIIPYQRNRDSGSQNYMTEFMGDKPLMDAPTEHRPASMAGLMDVIAVNDNSRAAIGYSVYAYAADMYGNGNEIKFLQVDGAAPSKAAFAGGSYPLMGINYAIFRADEPENSHVRNLAAWMTSQAGQEAIARAGYVTILPVDHTYPELFLKKYQGIGLGTPAGEMPHSQYTLNLLSTSDWGTSAEAQFSPVPEETPDGTPTYRVRFLRDKTLEAEINRFIDEQMVWVEAEYPDLVALVDRLNGEREYGRYGLEHYGSPTHPQEQKAACILSAKNGYLSVAVALPYYEYVMDVTTCYYRTETATWDLFTGKRLAPEELFCQGVDIDSALNQLLTRQSQVPDLYGSLPQMKQDFAALSGSYWHLTHDTLYIDQENPYFAHGRDYSLNKLPAGSLVCEGLRDFSETIDSQVQLPSPFEDSSGAVAAVLRAMPQIPRDIHYEYNADGLVSCGYLSEDAHPNAAKINNIVRSHLDTHYTEDAIRSYFRDLGYDETRLDLFMLDWWLEYWGGKYLIFQGWAPEYYVEESNTFLPYPFQDCFLFNLETGGEITWQEMLRPGWEEHMIWDQGNQPIGWPEIECDYFQLDRDGSMTVAFSESGHYYTLTIPADWIDLD